MLLQLIFRYPDESGSRPTACRLRANVRFVPSVARKLPFRFRSNLACLLCAHGSRAQAYWMQGKLNRAMDDEREALSWAHKIDYVGSRVHALGLTLLHRVYRRDYQEVFDRAGELIAFAADGVADHGAAGLVFRGGVIATQSDPAAGLQILAEGLARQLEVATSEDFSVYLCLQAEALAAAGQADKAVEDLLRERPQFDRSGLRIWLPEVLRMTGEMMLLADPGSMETGPESVRRSDRHG